MADRTNEFRALIAALPKPPPGMAPPPPPPRASATAAAAAAAPPGGSNGSHGASKSSQAAETARFLKTFHGNAAVISRKIYETSQRLSHMSRLVQRKGLFDDPAEEINTLMHAIKEDIQGLNSLVEGTQRSVDDFKYRQGSHGAHQQLTSHSQHVVGALRMDLADATQAFKHLLQRRSAAVKEQYDRRGVYGARGGVGEGALVLGKPAVYRPMQPPPQAQPPQPGSSSSSSSSSLAFPSPSSSSFSPAAQDSATAPLLPRPWGSGGGAGGGGGGGGMQQLQTTQHQQQQLLIPEQQYLEARAQAIEDVESHIVELGSIFNRLAHMIQEQRELVERIEDNVDDTHENVSRTRDYLLSVYSRLSSNGPLMVKTFMVLIAFIIFFVVFVA